MRIFIDESGSFVPTTNAGSWCVVAAYVAPEDILKRVDSALHNLKLACGKADSDEVKLNDVNEPNYIAFLQQLSGLAGTLYCSASEMSSATIEDIERHRDQQARRIVAHIHTMKYEEGKESYTKASAQVGKLSAQLYLQLVCQIEVLHQVIDRAVLYYVQRRPQTLRQFVWSIDQKNSSKTEYEDAFEKVAPGALQAMSIERPSIALKGGDYSAMRKFAFDKDSAPHHLNETYKLGVEVVGSLNISKILKNNMQFVNSATSTGVQVADLLVSGIRRALRGQFKNQVAVARLLGRLMVQNVRREQVPRMISLASGGFVNGPAKEVVVLFNQWARRTITQM